MTFLPDDLIDLWQAALGGLVGYAAVLLAVRIVGLRSFAKMTAHDFAVTVAVGSILATAALANDTPLAAPICAIATLFTLQFLLSSLFSRSRFASRLLQNEPVFLMDGPRVLHDNLRRAKISESELRCKLREANVRSTDQVLAVVFETTGDVSVLHGEPGGEIQEYILADVRSRNGRRAE